MLDLEKIIISWSIWIAVYYRRCQNARRIEIIAEKWNEKARKKSMRRNLFAQYARTKSKLQQIILKLIVISKSKYVYWAYGSNIS